MPVIDVTPYADDLQLNQGQIRGGEVVFGPGEAIAHVGSEGQHVAVRLRDGQERQDIITELAVDVSIPQVRR